MHLGQAIGMPKRLSAQIEARKKQDITADVEGLGDALKTKLYSQISDLERRIERRGP